MFETQVTTGIMQQRQNYRFQGIRAMTPWSKRYSLPGAIALLISGLLILGIGVRPVWAQADSSPNPDRGAVVFAANCAGCHAQGGNIIRRGKSLKQRALQRYHMDDLEAIATIVTQGKMPMSGYADRLSSQEIYDVAAYVLQQAEAGWPS